MRNLAQGKDSCKKWAVWFNFSVVLPFSRMVLKPKIGFSWGFWGGLMASKAFCIEQDRSSLDTGSWYQLLEFILLKLFSVKVFWKALFKLKNKPLFSPPMCICGKVHIWLINVVDAARPMETIISHLLLHGLQWSWTKPHVDIGADGHHACSR